jgi:hypothetical protein
MKSKFIILHSEKKIITILCLISLCYSFLGGSGFYGYSNDYYGYYNQENLGYYKFNEFGIVLSTLAIKNVHLGVYLTSFFLALSSGLMFKNFLEIKKTRSPIFLFFIFVIALHAHPLIMSTSGAMRQGWAMIFIFFSIFYLLTEKKFLSFIMITISLFMHKSGLFFFALYLLTIISSYFLERIKQKKFFFIFLSFILVIFFCYFMQLSYLKETKRPIVGGDFRLFWAIINIIYVFYYLTYYNFILLSKTKKISLFLYYFCLLAPLTIFFGFTYSYERLNMMVSIPLIFTSLFLLKKKSFYFSLSFVFLLYLFLTFYQGMYSYGLK